MREVGPLPSPGLKPHNTRLGRTFILLTASTLLSSDVDSLGSRPSGIFGGQLLGSNHV